MADTLQVDMMAEARNAQWSADAFLGPGAIKAVAPAKVNLFLGVGEQRADGYHDVVNVMHALALHDVLYFHRAEGASEVVRDASRLASAGYARDGAAGRSEAENGAPDAAARVQSAAELSPYAAVVGPAENLTVTVTMADKTQAVVRALDIPAAENLVVRALDALARAIDYEAPERIAVQVEKNVPHQAGLGGGSSDAAAALAVAARWWGLAPDAPVLQEVAAGLGADVAFFLQGGCSLLAGAGERAEARLEPAKLPVVLVKPSEGVSTAQAYAQFDAAPQLVPDAMLAQARDATCACDVPLFNNLAPAAEALVSELADVRVWLVEQLAEAEAGASAAALSGASSTQDVAETGSASLADTASKDALVMPGVQETGSALQTGAAAPGDAACALAALPAASRVLLCGSGSCTFGIADSFAQASRIAARASARGWWARATSLSSLKAAAL